MPITVTAPRGVLTAHGEREILPRLTAALIEASGLTGNSFFTAAVGGTTYTGDALITAVTGAREPSALAPLRQR